MAMYVKWYGCFVDLIGLCSGCVVVYEVDYVVDYVVDVAMILSVYVMDVVSLWL